MKDLFTEFEGYSPPVLITWERIERDEATEAVISQSSDLNLIVNTGRDLMLKSLFALSGSAPVVCMCVGASTTAAAVADTRLTYELNFNAQRKPLTNTAGAALSPADIVSETTTISGVTYYRKLIAQAIWDSTDLNNGNQFGEYGLNTDVGVPATPITVKGVLFNHFIDPSPINKTSSNTVTAQMTIRF